MKVLVVGGGGREHALCWKLRQSPLISELYCAPGNPGIAEVADLVPIQAEEIHQLGDFAKDLGIALTVVGPELPLSLGLADELANRGLAVFGPTQAAAEIESSKVFAKQFMTRHGIPTPDFHVAHERAEAEAAAKKLGLPVVLKADGLAAGKGVLIPRDEAELVSALDTFFAERRFGASGDRVVVERCLAGEEITFMVLSDGTRVLPLAACRDYKRLGDGDTGPNTGGMGAHSPAGVLESDVAAEILERVIRPAIEGLAKENRPLRGVLYAGLMLTEQGPQVLEFNARLGDPETQPLMLRLEDDLLPVLQAGAAGNFGVARLQWRHEAAACVVLASAGYPGVPVKGEPITGIEQARTIEGVQVFHAATTRRESDLVTAGGRVLNVAATGINLRDALRRAYGAAALIDWPSKILRKDIGRTALELSESRA
ncbi:MAG TPA: phosphoribosylamine--glycine ligase [Thermoanaerobaculia bacterium]|jgi:phosphoribosylamine--glycine ligase|nr:phosphoribosylamine--glycine ligase [Thermoanaerobaculia bacterium]